MISRRTFLAQTALATAAATVTLRADEPAPRWKVVTFTKPFQSLSFDDTADLIAEVGYDGIELPLRANGQIKPERTEEQLPLFVEALKKRGKVVDHITTDIVSLETPHAEKILRTAKKLGITKYRLGFFRYDMSKPILPQLDEIKPRLRDLAALNKEIGITGGIQNHSGAGYIGAGVWDIHELVRDLAPADLGICFDIGHATVEGGMSWPNQARLMQSRLTSVYVKDAYWEKGEKGWAPKWVPFGEGAVSPHFFKWLKTTQYSGAICQHCEYLTGASAENRAQMKKDLAKLREWLG